MTDAISSSLRGFNIAQRNVANAASNIARAGTINANNISTNNQQGNTTINIANETVNLIRNEYAAKANLSALHIVQNAHDRLLDIFV